MKMNGNKIEECSISIYYSPEDSCYVADVLEFDGHCMAHGDSREEALREINIAIKGWLKTAKGSRKNNFTFLALSFRSGLVDH